MQMQMISTTILKYSTQFKLDPAIVFGICKTESSLIPSVTRYESEYKYLFKPNEFGSRQHSSIEQEREWQKTSWGLMQVMGAVLREYGFFGDIPTILKDIDAQILYGCKHLKKYLDCHKSYELAILAYNAGSPRRKKDGTWINKGYLDKVMQYSEGWPKYIGGL